VRLAKIGVHTIGELAKMPGWSLDKTRVCIFTVYRAAKAGVSGGEKPFMTYQPEKQNNSIGQCRN